ncbi:phage tail protein [Argonema antarcticum]|uniref:phage tail protein n=1 Tax=Argonema antarcticum TaxID=2942763 RepID=UPI0020126C7B|nr:phage tail protein [Argonema antarcticum]MCL1472422.1 phage tail protein [Argonema antarcticum A004/B2]
MISFGLITEGLTDQIVIEDILSGYFNTDDIIVNPLQPERDKDNENKSDYGGWTLVFKYCQSNDFREAFQFNEYVIIQIDTDVSEEKNYNIHKRDENGELTPEQLIEKVKEKFQLLIGEDFYIKYNHKIIFAITVYSIECWLLPLYYQDKRKAKITNCLNTLNQELGKRESFTIDANNKNPQYYRKVSRQYCEQKVLMKLYQENPSFKVFIQEIEKRNIVIEDDG